MSSIPTTSLELIVPAIAFISHSSKDATIAVHIRDWLEQHNVASWFAPRDGMAGEAYGKSIVEAIKASRVLVVIVSANALASEHVQREVTLAVSNNVPVIPFRIDGTEPTGHLAYLLASLHVLHADVGPLESHLPSLKAAIDDFVAGRPSRL